MNPFKIKNIQAYLRVEILIICLLTEIVVRRLRENNKNIIFG